MLKSNKLFNDLPLRFIAISFLVNIELLLKQKKVGRIVQTVGTLYCTATF